MTTRTNLCANPSFETDVSGWAFGGAPGPTFARSTALALSGAASMLVTSTGAEVNLPDVRYDFNTVSGVPYTLSAYVYVPAGMPTVNLYAPLTSFGTTSTLFNQWERLYVTFTPNATTGFYVALLNHSTAAGQTFYVDKVLCEQSATLNPYIEGTVTTVPFSGWGVPR